VLYTYRAFMTGPQLFMALVNRFNAEPPVDPTPEEVDYYNECIAIVRLKYGLPVLLAHCGAHQALMRVTLYSSLLRGATYSGWSWWFSAG